PAKTQVAARTQTALTTTSIAATTTAPASASTAPTSTGAVIDPSKVNEEVAKRLAAEKLRLEQLARTQNQPVTTPAQRPAVPPPQQVATQTVAPPPVIENRPAPAPQPVVPAP